MYKKAYYEKFESLYYYHGVTQNWKMNDYHHHPHYEFLLFLSDGVTFELERRIFQAGRGDLFCINRDAPHRSRCKGTYERTVLMIGAEFLEPFGEVFGYDFTKLFNSDGLGAHLTLSGSNLDLILSKFDNIEQNLAKGMNSTNNEIQLKLRILDFVNDVDRIHRMINYAGDDVSSVQKSLPDVSPELYYREQVEQIKKYISDNIEQSLKLQDIADHFNMSTSYLSHYFKRGTGFTLTQFISHRKINLAKQLLLDGHSVTDVAMKLSYSSPSHFITNFKKATGITPLRYSRIEEEKENII